ncbi:homocysteine S-methyltransferase [Natranaerovirga hydrolytica]|uniref:Homocysteine S-methyltransferase n=1 Tax=Natranaerovirga hydrolytica TaxID=680378 RepID=A0A4R1MYW9_9FIRM|nr:bifunctional homocysteine S-methyltransferase/methylenetetrahydrofolate reductase [Natranaerovirga hydrolytica]TCK98446.1 homocysteine S-methyltransferase [Natranaerovirga hydrolytica]
MNLKHYLQNNILITDGAMGTYYAQVTQSNNTLSEKANIHQPDIIYNIHKEYIEAGAKLIRTNTFSANTKVLEQDIKGVKEIIKKAYALAQQAVSDAKEDVVIASSIGPIPDKDFLEEEDLFEEYKAIVDTFLKVGADTFIFETFSDINYLQDIVPYIKSKNKNATVITEFALNIYGYTKKGKSANRLLDDLRKIEDIDLYGFNCGIGAGHLYQIMQKVRWSDNEILTAMPNSGYPDVLQDRTVYMDNTDYFVDTMIDLAKLGVKVIGGCCGTTPMHIQKLNEALKDFSMETIRRPRKVEAAVSTKAKKINALEKKFTTNEPVIAVELDPPFGQKIDKMMEAANLLKANDVDIITIADSPMGKPRADALIVASKVSREVGIPVMPHICCRDKNVIGLKAQILGGYIEGIRDLLLVTGDPIPSGDRNEIKSVFNLNSITLMEMLREMNIEHFEDEPIFYGGALNPNRANIDKEIERMQKKIDAGAKFFLTQPIYDEATIEKIKYIKSKVDTKILGGVLPLVNIRNARFIQNEIIGITVPDEVIHQFDEKMTREESEKIGIEIGKKVALKMKNIVDGFYFMVPFNRVNMINEIIKALKKG